MVYCIGAIIWGVIWGFATNAVIHNKGYDDNWFWWGFFFGFIALIVAATKPEKKNVVMQPSGQFYTDTVLSNNQYNSSTQWKCDCGRINYNYVSTCTCGRNQREVLAERAKSAQMESKKQAQQESVDNIEAIKKYKELLDSGIISLDEFEEKKRTLLDL